MYPGCTVSNCSIQFPFRQCPIHVIPHYKLFFLVMVSGFVENLRSGWFRLGTPDKHVQPLISSSFKPVFFRTEKKNSEEIKSDGTVRNWCTLMFLFLFFSRRRNHKFDEFLAEVNQCAKFHRNPRPWLIWNLDMEKLDMESFMYTMFMWKKY